MEETTEAIALKYLKVTFDCEIEEWELPAFRGAISDKASASGDPAGSVLFHNHQPDGTLRREYPLIQYKRIGRRPALICLGEGVAQVHRFFSLPTWDIEIGNRPIALRIDRMALVNYQMKQLNGPYEYHLRHWAALNQQDYARYQEARGALAKMEVLEDCLHKSLAYFAEAVGLQLPAGTLECYIEEIVNHRIMTVHGQKASAFDLYFRANISIPDYVGIGKGASIGFGVVSRSKISTI